MSMVKNPYKRNCELAEGDALPEGIQRIALAVEYNGAAFHGFQSQPAGVNTVQSALQHALSRVADEPIKLICAGRTDACVHATNQIVHFDTLAERKDRAWVFGTNTHLPQTVVVRWSKQVPGQFHARFSALKRTYRYIISNSFVRPALMSDLLTWQRHPLNVEIMRAGAQCLLGEHDFTSFRASQCQAKSPVRSVDRIDIARRGELVVVEIQANAFLHHMVRNIMGVLMEIGLGKKPLGWVTQVLEAKNRQAAALTAPANGLYLVHVQYDLQFGLPPVNPGPHFLPDPLGGFSE